MPKLIQSRVYIVVQHTTAYITIGQVLHHVLGACRCRIRRTGGISIGHGWYVADLGDEAET
jgi:hypothetical protein